MDMLSQMKGPERDDAKHMIRGHSTVVAARRRLCDCGIRCMQMSLVDAVVDECVDGAVDVVYQWRTECPGSRAGWQVFVGANCLREFDKRLRDCVSDIVRRDHVLRMAQRSSARALLELVVEHGWRGLVGVFDLSGIDNAATGSTEQ